MADPNGNRAPRLGLGPTASEQHCDRRRVPPGRDAIPTEGDVATPVATIVLADDHAVVRRGLRMLLDAEDGVEVVAEAGDVGATLRKVRGYQPSVLVLDLNMPGGSSLEAIPRLLEASPGTRIVVLTMEDEPQVARVALRAGALAFVLKEAADTELDDAVHAALAGQRYLNPRLGARVATEPEATTGAVDGLSDRELEVLRLLALGYTNGEVANKLFLSVRTIESHRSHIQRKTGATSRAGLVSYAREHDLFG
ncbi:MAG TPA: response regulator transcription factor [Solirubrobacteraceae bacterium]|nr:response regulator transcription factor [Solirubrobacteraceae bacterium]